MKYLIVSDVHGFYSELCKILDKENEIKDVIFLGDGLDDIKKAEEDYPDRKFYKICGNCDVPNGVPSIQFIEEAGHKIMLTHGDGFDVKMGTLALRRAAINMGADIVLYGHTHKQYYEYLDGLYIFCPGSVKPDISTGYCASYGIMDFSDGVDIYNCELETIFG